MRERDEREALTDEEIAERDREHPPVGRVKARPVDPMPVTPVPAVMAPPTWLSRLPEIVVDYDEMAKEWRVKNVPEDTPPFIVEAIRVMRTIMGPPSDLTERQTAFLARVPEAVERARAKHPWSGDRWKALGALTGEVGELANVMNKKENQERLESEALDVIATVIRLVVEG